MLYREVLPNGLVIVGEEIPHVESVSMGVWVKIGSAFEVFSSNGISHFTEHALFKGTHKRTAKEIAQSLEVVGGNIDALTGKEYTAYWAWVLKEHLPLAIEVLSDLLFHPRFDEVELNKEKRVVLEEIKSRDDNPREYLHQLFYQTVWSQSPLGLPILGKEKVVRKFSPDMVKDFHAQNYRPSSMILSVCGNFRFASLLNLIKRYFGEDLGKVDNSFPPVPQITSDIVCDNRNLEQVNFSLGTRGVGYSHPQRFAALVLEIALGGGMSSRLFQKIREEEGLTYDIASYLSMCRDTGLFFVYGATNRGKLKKVIELILKELSQIRREGISSEELKAAKAQLKGSLVLASESTYNRMSRLALYELYFNRLFSWDETLERIDAVREEEVKELAGNLFQDEFLTLVTVGPVTRKELGIDNLSLN